MSDESYSLIKGDVTVDGQYTLVADDAWDWEHFNSLSEEFMNAVGSTDEGNVLWSAECSLKDGKLVYETATLELNVYDENKGETTTTPYGEEKGGTIELKDGKLIFSGVSSELFKGRSFVSYHLTSM